MKKLQFQRLDLDLLLLHGQIISMYLEDKVL